MSSDRYPTGPIQQAIIAAIHGRPSYGPASLWELSGAIDAYERIGVSTDELKGGFGGPDALGTDPRACASSSFKWFKDLQPLTFAELGQMGFKFTFITLGGQHATGLGLSELLAAMAERQEQGYIRSSAASGKLGRTFPRVGTTSGAAFRITTS